MGSTLIAAKPLIHPPLPWNKRLRSIRHKSHSIHGSHLTPESIAMCKRRRRLITNAADGHGSASPCVGFVIRNSQTSSFLLSLRLLSDCLLEDVYA